MRLWSLVVGIVTAAVTTGLFVVVHVGPSVFAAALVAAAMFFAAGLAFGRLGEVGIAIGGCIPIVASAIAGFAFDSLVWAGPLLVVIAGFTFAGAAARRGRRGAAIAFGAWLVVAIAGRPLIGALTTALSTERQVRAVAPFTLTTDRGALQAGELRGRVVVLAFWATWCEPCSVELPELATLAARYRDDPRVAVLWVNAARGGDTFALARSFAADHHVALPLAFDGGGLADALGITGMPAIAVLDTEGRLRLLHRGFDRSESLADQLGREIDHLLAP